MRDPRAVPSIWSVFAQGGPDDQSLAVRLLGQLDGPSASRALLVLDLSSASTEVRRVALETLVRRDPRDVAGLLVGLLIDPIKVERATRPGPGAPGVVLVEGDRFNVRTWYTVPPLPDDTIRRMIDPTTPPAWTGPIAASARRGVGDGSSR